jgi:hypothetical protein
MPSSSVMTAGDKETTLNSGKYNNPRISNMKGSTFSSNFSSPSRFENTDKHVLSPKWSPNGSKTRYSQEFIQSSKAFKEIRVSSYDILNTNEQLFSSLSRMNNTSSKVFENMKTKIRRVSNEVKEIEEKLYGGSTRNLPPVNTKNISSLSNISPRMGDSRRSSNKSSPRDETLKLKKTKTRKSNLFEKSKDENFFKDKLNHFENLSPNPKYTRKSISINFDPLNRNRGSITKKLSQNDIDKLIEHKKSVKKLEKKMELNEKLFDYINNLNKKDKPIDIRQVKFKKLSESYENQLMPYLKHIKFDNIDKYDYIRKIESGDIIKDEICTNFMNRIIPGNILFKGSGIHNLEILQPRFIKTNFKKKFEIFEGLKPRTIVHKKENSKHSYKLQKKPEEKN